MLDSWKFAHNFWIVLDFEPWFQKDSILPVTHEESSTSSKYDIQGKGVLGAIFFMVDSWELAKIVYYGTQ